MEHLNVVFFTYSQLRNHWSFWICMFIDLIIICGKFLAIFYSNIFSTPFLCFYLELMPLGVSISLSSTFPSFFCILFYIFPLRDTHRPVSTNSFFNYIHFISCVLFSFNRFFAEVQPRLIQGIQRRDGVGDLFKC